jgi:hypothetical protein
MRKLIACLVVPLAVGVVEGCSCENATMGEEDLAGGGGVDLYGADIDPFDTDMYIGIPTADGGIVITTDAGTFTCFITPCQGKVYQCGNCKDDDNDGLVDSQDPNCLGACQNNESGFIGNIPGQNNAPCKADCYWDQDTGSGNDTCEWDHRCDPFEAAPPPAETSPEIGCKYDPNGKYFGGNVSCADKLATQTPTCGTFCKPLTPNGCDCFGCCENPNMPGTFVFAGSQDANKVGTCSVANLNDPTKCKACTPVPGCQNTCGRCELCFGKTTLPPDCYPDMAGMAPTDGGIVVPDQCEPGIQPCGLPGQAPCAPGYYCVTGCCQALIP